MADINSKLQKFNPGLVGSQVTSDHLSENTGLTKGKLNQLPGNFDDQRSMISLGSNITGFSRKSALSMLNMDSIISFGDFKKMPGEKGLQQNAKRRMEKAQMANIEMNLKKIQESKDLSYQMEGSMDAVSVAESTTDKLDSMTLARLIDECREEQEQSQIEQFHADDKSSVTLYQQSELSMMQLSRVDQSERNLH